MDKKSADFHGAAARHSQPLSVAFSTPSALAVLRALSRAHAEMSLRSLARMAEISHRTCALVIDALERAKLVERFQVGKSSIAKLNEGNAIISELLLPLLDRERAMVDEIEGSIHGQFGGMCQKIVLRGAATGAGKVYLIAEPGKIEKVKALAREMAAGFEERYGFDIEFRAFTYEDAPLDMVLG